VVLTCLRLGASENQVSVNFRSISLRGGGRGLSVQVIRYVYVVKHTWSRLAWEGLFCLLLAQRLDLNSNEAILWMHTKKLPTSVTVLQEALPSLSAPLSAL
jgi:hypothetical protein